MFAYTGIASAGFKSSIKLLEQIDGFDYPLLKPKYSNLGELHSTLTVELLNYLDYNDKVIERITLGEIKKRIKELEAEKKAIEERNEKLKEKMRQTQNFALEEMLERFYGEDELERLKKIVEEHKGEPDDTIVEIEWELHFSGCYMRKGNDAKILLEDMYLEEAIASLYIHEMMHAFYDSDRLGDSPNSIKYVEEPLAEYGKLHFLTEFVKKYPAHKDLLKYAINSVKSCRYYFGLYHYAFGEYLYKNYSHIDWEKLLLAAKDKVDVNSPEYKSLQEIFQARPNESKHDQTAQLLYDILTKAIGMPSKSIAVRKYSTIKEQIMTEEILPIIEHDIEPILDGHKQKIIFEVEYTPGQPIDVTLINKTKITRGASATSLSSVSRNNKAPLVVTFPDGTVFDDSVAKNTFVKTIEKIGLYNVAMVGLIDSNGYNLVDTRERPKIGKTGDARNWQTKIGTYYVYSYYSIDVMICKLMQISKYYDLDLRIEDNR